MGQKKYPDELRERATRMALDALADPARAKGAIRRIGEELGVHPEALRTWVKKAQVDGGLRPGTTTDEAQRIKELEKEVRELRRANAILKSASACLSRRSVSARPVDLPVHRDQEGGVRGLADLQGAHWRRSQDRPEHLLRSQDPSPISQERARRGPQDGDIQGPQEPATRCWGARKMHIMLNRPEVAERHGAGHVARCTVERLMGDLGLRGVRRAKSPRTTRSVSKDQCPADLVKRHFEAFAPGGLWVADIPPQAGGAPSYVRAFSRWVYVAFVTDVYSLRIIGSQTTYRPVRTDLALDALKMAVWQRKRQGADRCITCDRGVQYRSIRYGQALSDCEAVTSVGSKGGLLSASPWPRRSTRCTRPS